MAKRQVVQASASEILEIFISDSSSTTGAGLTGLVFNTASLTCYYHINTAASAVAVALVTMTVGTFTSSGFKEVDATNQPGVYQLCLPNAAYASGKSVFVVLKGATNMAPLPFEIEITQTNNQSAASGGMTNLDATVSSRFAGGAVASVTAGVTVTTNNDKTGYSLLAGQLQVKKNQALTGFSFPMYSNTSHQMTTSLSVTAVRSIDGAAIASCANAVTEVGSGIYTINLAAADLNGTSICVKFSAVGADDLSYTFVPQP